MRRFLTLIPLTAILFHQLFCTIIHVPDDQPTIQAGIDVSVENDTVLVHEGTYYENVRYYGKNISLGSLFLIDGDTGHIENTIIDGSQYMNPDSAFCVGFAWGETRGATLTGFTITGGEGVNGEFDDFQYGGGLCIGYGASPIIAHNVITGNHADYGGGLAFAYQTSALLIDNQIIGNSADGDGGAVFLGLGPSPTFENNIISNNVAASEAGAICSRASSPVFRNCVISGNQAFSKGAIDAYEGSYMTLVNCNVSDNVATHGCGGMMITGSSIHMTHTIFTNNSALTWASIYFSLANTVDISRCDIYGNTPLDFFSIPVLEDLGEIVTVNENGTPCDIFYNIYDDPLFENLADDEYKLLVGSPCIDAGAPDTTGLNLPEFDLIGNPRITDGNGDDLAVIDMGAYEFQSEPTITLINVPEDYATIQEGIDASVDGDTVLVQPGTYVENVNFNGHNITLGSMFIMTGDTSYISQTVIDGDSSGSVVTFESGEDSTAVLSGFTITGGLAEMGGGIHCEDFSPNLSDLVLSGNHADFGGGIFCENSNPEISNVLISDNHSSHSGGGIHLQENSSPILTDVSISNNTVGTSDNSYSQGRGGGISIEQNSHPVLTNVDIINNAAQGSFSWSGGGSGIGGGINCSESNPSLSNVVIRDNIASANNACGGGISFRQSNPVLTNVELRGNSAVQCGYQFWSWEFLNTGFGGGIVCSASNPSFSNVTITGNWATGYEHGLGGGIFSDDNSNLMFDSENRSNIYLNHVPNWDNAADIYSDTLVTVIVDTFTTIVPLERHAAPLDNFSFDILNGRIEPIDADLFVSPEGDNDNDGLTADSPLKTIYYANSIIVADSLNPHTINLMAGNYSPSTNGEFFPIYVPSYLSIVGESEDTVILDADSTAGVIYFNQSLFSGLSNVTITGGVRESGGGIHCSDSNPVITNLKISNNSAETGGGIYCLDSNPVLNNLTILDNYAGDRDGYGGGIALFDSDVIITEVEILYNISNSTYWENTGGGGGFYSDNSTSILTNVDFINNTSIGTETCAGGGIYCVNSDLSLSSLQITHNSATSSELGFGGGVYSINSNLIFDNDYRCNVFGNEANFGSELFSDQFQDVVVDTFTVPFPTDMYAHPIQNFSFDLMNSIIPQVNSDMYVSTQGDNSNSGLSWDDPIQNIFQALSLIDADSLNPRTIYLAPGIYSPTQTNEYFPIHPRDYIHIQGYGDQATLLVAEAFGGVIRFENVNTSSLTDLTVTGGSAVNGGGVSCNNSNPLLMNLIISNNSADENGGGLFCDTSSPILSNVIIRNNIADTNGGGLFCYNSDATLTDLTLQNNTAIHNGGGMYCDQSSPIINTALIIANTAHGHGAGVYCKNSSNLQYTQATITENTAWGNGGGIYCWIESNPEVTNSIIWNNSPQQIYFRNSEGSNSVIFAFSDIQGGLEGIETNNNGEVFWLEGNIDADPLFDTIGDNPFALTADSPCIDAGDPNTPLDPDGTISDMGAYYFHHVLQDDPTHFDYILNGHLDDYLAFADSTGFGEYSILTVDDIEGGELGDEIGFLDFNGQTNFGDCSDEYGQILVGAGVWMGEPLEITTYGAMDFCDEVETDYGQYPGWIAGNEMVIILWRQSEDQEYLGNYDPVLGELTWENEPISIPYLTYQQLDPYDVNGDYATDILDVIIIIEYILEETDLSPEQLLVIDTNADGTINIFDVVTVIDTILYA